MISFIKVALMKANTLQLGEHELDDSSAIVEDSEASAPPMDESHTPAALSMDDSPTPAARPLEQPPVPAPRKSK